MKLSELIKQMQDYIAENGDVEVLMHCDGWAANFREPNFRLLDMSRYGLTAKQIKL